MREGGAVPLWRGAAGNTGGADDGRLRVAILGSTGSIGESALRVIERHADRFTVTVLTANRSVELLEAQASRHRPAHVVVCDELAFEACRTNGSEWVGGRQALLDVVIREDVDVVVNALVGFAGLEPSILALKAGKRLALANKESLVTGGDLVLDAVHRGGGTLVPVDSEHSAILQCLHGHPHSEVEAIILTASGGPFRGWDEERLATVGPSDALRHPTWEMGAGITIASATLANKALEVIEAHVLYGVHYDSISAVVHPQSVIHSMVEFVDGSVVAQLGFPTMELPILYALTWPDRLPDAELRTFDPVKSSPLTFESVDHQAFPIFGLGVQAGRTGGTAPTVFNAANEVAIGAFLDTGLSFQGMADVVADTLAGVSTGPVGGLEDLMDVDREAREFARNLIRHPGPDVKRRDA